MRRNAIRIRPARPGERKGKGMRIQFILNNGDPPASKLAEVEIHFEEGCLSGLKLLGCSVWHTKKGQRPTVLVPCRSYATAGGVRYYQLLRPSADDAAGKEVIRKLKDFIRDEYFRVADLSGGKDRGTKKPKGKEA